MKNLNYCNLLQNHQFLFACRRGRLSKIAVFEEARISGEHVDLVLAQNIWGPPHVLCSPSSSSSGSVICSRGLMTGTCTPCTPFFFEGPWYLSRSSLSGPVPAHGKIRNSAPIVRRRRLPAVDDSLGIVECVTIEPLSRKDCDSPRGQTDRYHSRTYFELFSSPRVQRSGSKDRKSTRMLTPKSTTRGTRTSYVW